MKNLSITLRYLRACVSHLTPGEEGDVGGGGGRGSQLPACPLRFLHNVQAAVQDELVQVPRLLGEPRLPIAALLAGAEFVLEERVVLGADDGEVVAHCWALVVSVPCLAV